MFTDPNVGNSFCSVCVGEHLVLLRGSFSLCFIGGFRQFAVCWIVARPGSGMGLSLLRFGEEEKIGQATDFSN